MADQGSGGPDKGEEALQALQEQLEQLHLLQGEDSEGGGRPPKVLEEMNIDGVVKLIQKMEASGNKQKIIVMTGAGISTAAGIPDFRSPDTGLYANLQKYNLPNPQAIFDINYFRHNPKPFFHLARELYPGNFKDYRFTAALSLLKLVRDQQDSQSQRKTTSTVSSTQTSMCAGTTVLGIVNEQPQHTDTSVSCTSGGARSRPGSTNPCSSPSPPAVVPEGAIKLALRACEAFLSSKKHEDIEGSQYQLCPKLSDGDWTTLVQHSYSACRQGAQIYCSYHLARQADCILDQVGEHFPQLHMDGSRNIWIVKPGALSRGRGIMCMDSLEDILALVARQVPGGIKENKWVVQKYIERPLLIHRTKFDIRQWFLVTDWNPLTMWMYKECYMRFSTQNYTLDNMDQSVHLCNNSIQKHYDNSSSRSNLLPEENMWDSDTFQDHLRSLGEGDKWDSVIYPGMKQALVHVLQVTQDEIEQRKNAFELYGADFMISEDLKPWLIEINCSPTMEASTSITTRMCRQVMEDTIKVVVDRRENKDCDTGGFELVYKQPKMDTPSYVGIQLCVQGSAISHHKPSSSKKVPVAIPTVKLGYTTSKT